MTRLAALLVVALAVLAVGSERVQLVDEALGAGGVEVVVALESPPLAHAPGRAVRIAAEQPMTKPPSASLNVNHPALEVLPRGDGARCG